MNSVFSKLMKLTRNIGTSQPHMNEHGIVMYIVLFTMVAIVGLVGLAVDSGNLYRNRLRIQSAADAGVTKAIMLKALGINDSRSKAVGRMLIEENLQKAGLSYEASGITVDFEADGSVKAEVTANIPLLMIFLVPGVGSIEDVKVEAKAELGSAVVSIIVDHSGDMACPWGSTSCNCYPTCSNRKIDRVKPLVQQFVNMLDENKDYVSFVRFATGVHMARMPDASKPKGFDRDIMNLWIETIGSAHHDWKPRGASNLCDGVQRAILDSEDVTSSLGDGTTTNYVLFTDGSYNATRVQWANPKSTLRVTNGYPDLGKPAWANFDYLFWEMDLVHLVNLNVIGTGPQAMARAPLDSAYVFADLNANNSISCVNCENANNGCSAPGIPEPSSTFKDCIKDFSFNTVVGGTRKLWHAGNENFDDYEQLFYDCPLAWADASREKDAMWYVVGLEKSCNKNGNDPYQGAPSMPPQSQLCRHDRFLERLALSRDAVFSRAPTDDPKIEFPNFDTYTQMVGKGARHGEYLKAESQEDLSVHMRNLYRKIVLRQKVRLVK